LLICTQFSLRHTIFNTKGADMQRILVWLAVLFVILLGVTAHAAVDPTDLLIQKLIEKQLLTEEEASAIRADIAAQRQDEEAARKSYPVSAKKPVKISGYTQIRYTDAQGANTPSTFEARRVRLTLSGDATPDVDYLTMVDLSGARKAVTDNSFKTALFGKPVLLDAAVGVKIPANNKITLGQFKVPFGLENLTSDANLDTINRSQVTETLVPGRDNGSQGRDVGVQFGGSRPVKSAQVEYTFAVFNGAGINTGDDNDHKDLAARVAVKPGIDGLSFGLSHYAGASGTTEAARNRTGGEVQYLVGPWKLQGEYIKGKDGAITKHGWYALAVRTLKPTLQLVARYDQLDPDSTKNTDAVNSLTGGLTWLLSKDGVTRFQLNYVAQHEQGTQVENNQVLAQFQTGF